MGRAHTVRACAGTRACVGCAGTRAAHTQSARARARRRAAAQAHAPIDAWRVSGAGGRAWAALSDGGEDCASQPTGAPDRSLVGRSFGRGGPSLRLAIDDIVAFSVPDVNLSLFAVSRLLTAGGEIPPACIGV